MPFQFEAEIIVEMARVMLLNDIAKPAALSDFGAWFRRSPKVSFAFVFAEAHGCWLVEVQS